MPRRLFLAIAVAMFAISSWTPAAEGSPRFCHVKKASVALSLSGDQREPTKVGKAVLLASREKISAGATIYARVANFSREVVGYEPKFVIEKHHSTGWKVDPSSPSKIWPAKRGVLRPELAGRCYVFQIPSDQSRGRYRFSTTIQPQIDKSRFMRLKALFTVG